ncbi:zeta toxin family protein [Microbacterium sp. ASV49]|uniref:UDP-N-acetylglucosamine kinase n=1 Tax=Microbacterium candidum TaxID=3041922 RepID=A0ABT7MVW3_9MICO|nr:zeta toxin family protein [Microbacterium sp. ASV49]MDL9978591.1 zeta toxin family protein [Microbacterium sp. ASV49]
MSDFTPSDAERRRIFEAQIVPVVFPAMARADNPTLLLLGGQPGAGKSRATTRLLAESPAGMVALSGDDLRAFHPHFLELTRSRSVEAPQILAESTAGWLRDCIVHARTTGRSLLLEGTFHDPEVAVATAELFAREGFATRVVVVATPRAESLLATTSRYLLDARDGRASRFTSVSVHEGGWEGTRALVRHLEATPSVDRLTVLGRDGDAIFNGERSAPGGFVGASDALVGGQVPSMSSPAALRWLSELRAMTDYALATRRPAAPVAELLIELHRVAVREVLPRLNLPADSQARPAVEVTLATQIVALRRAIAAERPREDVAAPVVIPVQPDLGISR